MLGRIPVGQLIPAWTIGILFVLGVAALVAPMIKNKFIILGIVGLGAAFFIVWGFLNSWDPSTPSLFFLPTLQEWIFAIPTTAGARAIMIGIGLGIVGTSFRIIIGIERSFLGEQ